MKKLSGILGSLFLISTLCIGSAMAAETPLQEILDNITDSGTSGVTVATDALLDDMDSYWAVSSTFGSATMIIEIAGNAGSNTFGIYDKADETNTVQLYGGGATVGSKVAFSVDADGSIIVNLADTGIDFASINNFGFYLGTGAGNFYSDSDLNGGNDQMLAFAGVGDSVTIGGAAPTTWDSDEYIFAWEDISLLSSDEDYNDMVIMVDVNPVPEPATMLLFGTGLIGLAGFGSRKRSRKNA